MGELIQNARCRRAPSLAFPDSLPSPPPPPSSETLFLAKSLAEVCATQPGKYPPMIASALSDRPSGQKALQGFLTQAGVTLV